MHAPLASQMVQWEGREDHDKKAYCAQIKDQARLGISVNNTETRIDAVQKSISELDVSVATATEIRRTQLSGFVTLTASIAAATELLKLAANRPNNSARKLQKAWLLRTLDELGTLQRSSRIRCRT